MCKERWWPGRLTKLLREMGSRKGRENKVDEDVRKNLGLTFLERRNGGRIVFWSIL